MRMLSALAALLAAPAAAETVPVAPPANSTEWNPAIHYVTPGQDEAGYRAWFAAGGKRPAQVQLFNDYLTQYGVQGVVPTWQLLRTASSWKRCKGEPFEVPPASAWPNLVRTLRYIREAVLPAVGPVEPVSVYRNPVLNHCAGGSPESAHRHSFAIDLVPLQPITREDLIGKMCAMHLWRGSSHGVGLGFYAYLRFHVDSRKYRMWGGDGSPEASPCGRAIPSLAAVAAAEQLTKKVETPSAETSPQAVPAGGNRNNP